MGMMYRNKSCLPTSSNGFMKGKAMRRPSSEQLLGEATV
jgi:hypothetical protein